MSSLYAVPPLLYPDVFYTTVRTITNTSIDNNFEYIDMNFGKIIDVAEPVNDSDVATKFYVDTHGGSGNLTGPITAVAGVSSITSQTGIGTKFVVDTSPILVTPNIGAATASSINILNDITINGKINSFNVTDATNQFNGSITTFGGISAQKNIYSGGTCYATDFLSTSDKKLKTNIKDIDYTDILKFLKVKGYTYKLNGDIKYGVLAQDLEDVGLGIIVDNTSEYKKVSYQSLIPIMLETIKILDRKLEDNDTKFIILENRIIEIEKEIKNEKKEKKEKNKKRKSFKKDSR